MAQLPGVPLRLGTDRQRGVADRPYPSCAPVGSRLRRVPEDTRRPIEPVPGSLGTLHPGELAAQHARDKIK